MPRQKFGVLGTPGNEETATGRSAFTWTVGAGGGGGGGWHGGWLDPSDAHGGAEPPQRRWRLGRTVHQVQRSPEPEAPLPRRAVAASPPSRTHPSLTPPPEPVLEPTRRSTCLTATRTRHRYNSRLGRARAARQPCAEAEATLEAVGYRTRGSGCAPSGSVPPPGSAAPPRAARRRPEAAAGARSRAPPREGEAPALGAGPHGLRHAPPAPLTPTPVRARRLTRSGGRRRAVTSSPSGCEPATRTPPGLQP